MSCFFWAKIDPKSEHKIANGRSLITDTRSYEIGIMYSVDKLEMNDEDFEMVDKDEATAKDSETVIEQTKHLTTTVISLTKNVVDFAKNVIRVVYYTVMLMRDMCLVAQAAMTLVFSLVMIGFRIVRAITNGVKLALEA